MYFTDFSSISLGLNCTAAILHFGLETTFSTVTKFINFFATSCKIGIGNQFKKYQDFRSVEGNNMYALHPPKRS